MWISDSSVTGRINQAIIQAIEMAQNASGDTDVNVYFTYEGQIEKRSISHETDDHLTTIKDLVVFSRQGYGDEETLRHYVQ